MEWLYARGIPIEAQFLYRKALDLAARGRDEEALKYFRQAVIIAPGYARATLEMGNCYARLGRFAEALERYGKSCRIVPASGIRAPGGGAARCTGAGLMRTPGPCAGAGTLRVRSDS